MHQNKVILVKIKRILPHGKTVTEEIKLANQNNIIGCLLSGPDNDTYFFNKEDSQLEWCPLCRYLRDFDTPNPNYKIDRKSLSYGSKRALTYTYDGRPIVTNAFREFCERERYEGIKFNSFDHDQEHFYPVFSRIIQMDPIHGNTKFGIQCSFCNNYQYVTGGFEYVMQSSPIPDGLFRSDLIYGQGNNKNPRIIVGLETREKMLTAGLKGISFLPAYGSALRNAGE